MSSGRIDYTKWGFYVAIVLALVYGTPGLYLAYRSVVIAGESLDIQKKTQSEVKNTQAEVKNVRSDIAEVGRISAVGKLEITSPQENGSVTLTDVIRGTTPFPKRKHYLIVTPVEVGGDWVQDAPADVAGATWIGRAQFGQADVGLGQDFLVRVVATNSTIPVGPLRSALPGDAISSNVVRVRRTR